MKQFLIDLLQIPSISDDRDSVTEAMELVREQAVDSGLDTRSHEDPATLIAGRGDLSHPEIGILCHLDIVPPYFPPKVDANTIHGRGSIDMKGPAVAALQALIQSDHPNVAIAFTGDEETTADGAAYLSTTFIPQKVLLVPDQNRDFNITRESKGLLGFTAELPGASAHGSTPWAGTNAVLHGMSFYEELVTVLEVDNTEGWNNTLNLANITTSNTATNVIPERASMNLDFRFQDKGMNHWLQRVQSAAAEFDADIDVHARGERLTIELTEQLEMYMDTVTDVTGTQPTLMNNPSSCDARFYQNKVPTIIITKCSGGHSHSENEYVDYTSLEQFVTILRQYLERLRVQRIQPV